MIEKIRSLYKIFASHQERPLIRLLTSLYSRMGWFSSVNKLKLRPVASQSEFEFILLRIYAEAEAGHFNSDFLIPNPAIQGGLAKQILSAVNDLPFPFPPNNPRNGAGARISLIEFNSQVIGFVLLVEDRPGSWNVKIEIQLISIVPDFRNKGIGSQVIREIIEKTKATEIYARCYSSSTDMIRLLHNLNFVTTDTSLKGTKTLIYSR